MDHYVTESRKCFRMSTETNNRQEPSSKYTKCANVIRGTSQISVIRVISV